MDMELVYKQIKQLKILLIFSLFFTIFDLLMVKIYISFLF